jgi:hypothetical protein
MFSNEKQKTTPNKRSLDKNSTSSIAEDSNLMNAEASRGSSSKQKASGVIDESIQESLIEEEDGLDSGATNSGIIAKNKKIEQANRERMRKEHESEKEKTNRQIEEFK